MSGRRERCEPILPSHDRVETRSFYAKLGFRAMFNGRQWPEYEILWRGDIAIHFFHDKDGHAQDAGCYWRVSNADTLYQEYVSLGLPAEGAPRLTPIEDTPWGMREFNLVDPSGKPDSHRARTIEIVSVSQCLCVS